MLNKQRDLNIQSFNSIKMDKKAQVAIEFLFVIGIVLLIFIFVLTDVLSKKRQIDETQEIMLKKYLCLAVSSLISDVYTKGTGTEAYLKLTGEQLPFSVTIQPGVRNLFVGNTKSVYCTIPINSVSNSLYAIDYFTFNFSAENRILKFENIANFVVVSLGEVP